MELTEKIKWLNTGIGLGKRVGKTVGKTASIYSGDEDRAAFLIQALGELGLEAECDIYTIDGEYYVEVKL